jgi:hypothetical protein
MAHVRCDAQVSSFVSCENAASSRTAASLSRLATPLVCHQIRKPDSTVRPYLVEGQLAVFEDADEKRARNIQEVGRLLHREFSVVRHKGHCVAPGQLCQQRRVTGRPQSVGPRARLAHSRTEPSRFAWGCTEDAEQAATRVGDERGNLFCRMNGLGKQAQYGCHGRSIRPPMLQLSRGRLSPPASSRGGGRHHERRSGAANPTADARDSPGPLHRRATVEILRWAMKSA